MDFVSASQEFFILRLCFIGGGWGGVRYWGKISLTVHVTL